MIEPVLQTEDQILKFTLDNACSLIYFSTPDCGVCKSLKPAIVDLLQESFPNMAAAGVDCSATPALCASRSLFNMPAVITCFDGRETNRFIRNFSIGELREAIARPYTLLFE